MSERWRAGARPSARILDAFLEGELDGDEVPSEALLASAPSVPSDDLRARLLRSLETTSRFEDLEATVSELADVSIERAHALLLEVDTTGAWEAGPARGIEIFHFAGGPKVERAITGFVRMTAGVAFPEHGHVGDEHVLVLTGRMEDVDGTIFEPGDVARMPPGSEHGFRSTGTTTLLLMTIVQGGVRLFGQLVGPGDPRA